MIKTPMPNQAVRDDWRLVIIKPLHLDYSSELQGKQHGCSNCLGGPGGLQHSSDCVKPVLAIVVGPTDSASEAAFCGQDNHQETAGMPSPVWTADRLNAESVKSLRHAFF